MGMNYEVSIPTRLLFDKELSSIELRLYLIIRAYVNEDGYSRVKNETLAEYLDVSIRYIRDSISHLEELQLITRKENVKKGRIYPENYRRVLWLTEAYNSAYNIRAYRENNKRPDNDYKKFVEYLRTDQDMLGKKFAINHKDGKIGVYGIGYENALHFQKDNEWFKMKPSSSKEIFKILFMNRQFLFSDSSRIFNEVLNEDEERLLSSLNAKARVDEKAKRGNDDV